MKFLRLTRFPEEKVMFGVPAEVIVTVDWIGHNTASVTVTDGGMTYHDVVLRRHSSVRIMDNVAIRVGRVWPGTELLKPRVELQIFADESVKVWREEIYNRIIRQLMGKAA